MPLISLRQLLDHAAENNYGVPAFNVNNLEQIRAIMEGAEELNSPVIIQVSKSARKYAGPIFLFTIGQNLMQVEYTPFFGKSSYQTAEISSLAQVFLLSLSMN